MALAGRIPGGMGMGMGPMGGMAEEMEEHMRHMQEMMQHEHEAGEEVAFQAGQVVVIAEAHMPEHQNRAARVVAIAPSQPFYVLDFGDGKPHKWYAHEELKPAPAGTQPGQQVGGSGSGGHHS